LKDEMEFSTKHLAHFFTKVLDFLMTVCQELGFVPPDDDDQDDDGEEEEEDDDDVEERAPEGAPEGEEEEVVK